MLGLQLANLVTYNPRAVAPQTTLHECLQLMDENGFHHLPVVDPQRRVLGMVSDIDVAGSLSLAISQANASGETACLTPAAKRRVQGVMVQPAIAIDDGAAAEDALRLLVDHEFHALPVVVEGGLVGMLTSTDFLREFSYGGLALWSDPIWQYMIDPPGTISGAAAWEQAMETFMQHPGEHLVVLDQDLLGETVLGVLSDRQCRRAQLERAGFFPAQSVNRAAALTTVTDALVRPGTVFSPDQTLGDAAAFMLENNVRSVAIANTDGAPTGILRDDDILAAMIDHLG
jgi:CBS domain-containing protein